MTNQRLMQSRRVLLLLMLMIVGVWSGCGTKIKIHTEKYDNGDVKVEYQYYDHPENNARINHGWKKLYYENGKVKAEETFVDGKLVGKEVVYYESGKVKEEKLCG